MSGFLDFLTGGVQSGFSPEPSAPPPEPSQPRGGSNPFSDLFASTEQQYGLPAGYLERTARVESSFNPNAKNPNSSAGGLFQFIDGTAKQYGLSNRYDPVQATDAAARLARDNAQILKQALGRDPTPGELYLAHQQGAGGAVKLLSNPDAPAETIVGSAAARLNGGAGLTAGQLAQKWTAKIDGAQPTPRGGSPALAYAATRGRDPRANMPAPDATQAMGQTPMPSRQPMPDLSNTPDAGLRAMIAQQAGGMDMQGPSIGGLAGLGGMRMPGPSQGAAPAQTGGGAPDIESLVPSNRPNPLAFFGKPAMENQQAESQRQGIIAVAQMLVSKGVDPRQAVAMAQSPQALQMYQQEKQATENRAFQREQFEFQKKDKEADNKRADDAAMSAPRKILRDLGIEPGHPEYKDQYKRLAGLGGGASAEVAQRKQDAEALGLKPDNPGYQSYVLTGKMPREDAQPLSATDKKAILEADEGVMASESAIKALADAKKISPRALGGIAAGTRAMLGNALPDALVPDALASKDASLATAELDNIVSTNALSQLKSIFGAAPTEGERKILMDIQGSVSQPDNVRQAIYDRAIMMAEKRLQFNRQRANELRGGAYYKPGDKQAGASGAPAAPAPPPQADQPQPSGGGLKPGVYEFVPGKGLVAK
jgi:hypothetical protein